MDDVLLPCPFCGGSDLRIVYGRIARVACNKCKSGGPEYGNDSQFAEYIDRELAIDGWNKRQPNDKKEN